MKISIIGHCGSGKSTLARTISKQHAIPHLELDRLWFKHAANTTTHGDEAAKTLIKAKIKTDVEQFLSANESWVTDGIQNIVQNDISGAADLIIFIDIPLYRRQWNHLKRVITNKHRHRELSYWDELYFTWDMIRRTRLFDPQVTTILKNYSDKTQTVYSYDDMKCLLANIDKI